MEGCGSRVAADDIRKKIILNSLFQMFYTPMNSAVAIIHYYTSFTCSEHSRVNRTVRKEDRLFLSLIYVCNYISRSESIKKFLYSYI